MAVPVSLYKAVKYFYKVEGMNIHNKRSGALANSKYQLKYQYYLVKSQGPAVSSKNLRTSCIW